MDVLSGSLITLYIAVAVVNNDNDNMINMIIMMMI